jgi:hypothetical protein
VFRKYVGAENNSIQDAHSTALRCGDDIRRSMVSALSQINFP